MNTRTERARDDARERGTKEDERKGPAFLFIRHTLFFPDLLRRWLSMAGDSKVRFRVGRVNFVV